MKSLVFARVSRSSRPPTQFSLLLLAAASLLLPVAARAQTASFNYPITTLGGGFNSPEGVAVDGSGNVYVADPVINAVKEMPAGCASSSCATTLGGGFNGPEGVAVDGGGNVYVTDPGISAVKEMPAGCASSSCVTTLGGGFSHPRGVAVDGGGNVYVGDYDNSAVKEMPAGCASSSCVTTLGGGFSYPKGVAVDASGNVYVGDNGNSAVKEMPAGCASSSCVTTLGGGFNTPYGVAVDASGNVYVGDYGNSAVKEMPAGCASSSCVTTLGSGFSYPRGVAVDGSGNVYVSDYGNSAVKEIMTRGVNFLTVPVGTVSATLTLTFTIESAGSLSSTTPYQVLTGGATNLDFKAAAAQESNVCQGTTPYTTGESCTLNVTFTPAKVGSRNGAVELLNAGGSAIATAYVYGTGQGPQVVFSPATQSTLGGGFNSPEGVAVDGSGNVYVADPVINAVKEMPAGCASSSCATTLGGGFNGPEGVAVDGDGNVYVTDPGISAVKEMPAGCASSSCVTTLGGGFSHPRGVAVDGGGNVYVSDYDNSAVKEMPAGCASSSCVITLGGGFNYPKGVAVDASGNVYVGDNGNSAVKRMPAGCTSSSCVTELGGGFNTPYGVAVDASGNVYVGDYGNSAVKEMPAGCASSSCVTTLGSGFSYPRGVAVDGSGNVYVGDYGNSAVKEINRATPPSLSFVATTVGSTSSDSPQTVQVVNIGNQPLTFSTPVSGTNPSYPTNFPENAIDTNLCASGVPLAQGTSCDVSMSFAPTIAGANVDSVLLTDNNLNQTNATQSIALNGTGVKVTQTITFPAITGTHDALTSFTLSATASSGLTVSFASTSPTICTVSGTTASLLIPGVCVIKATQAGNADYAAAPAVSEGFAVSKATQTITFPTVTATQYAASTLTLSATASSGLAVTFTAAAASASVCTISGATATLLTQGTCIVQVNQAGNTLYSYAPTVQQNIVVKLAPQTITFPVPSGEQYALSAVPLTATTTSGLPITYASITPDYCTVTGSTAYPLQQGSCFVHASQAGNNVYSVAPLVTMYFTIHLAPQTITFPAITATEYVLTQLTLAATASSGLTVSFASATPAVCTVSGTTASLLTTGDCVIHATQAGNKTVYSIAPLVSQSFMVHGISQTITFPAIAAQTVGATVPLTATASSGLAVSYTSVTTAVCTVSGSTATMVSAGACVIHATQPGNATYAAAPPVAKDITVKAS